MKKTLSCVAAVLFMGSAISAANAAPIPIELGSYDVNLAGTVAGTDLSAMAHLTVTTFDSTHLTVGVTLHNTTSSATPGVNRLVSFGFDLDPDSNRTLTGASGSNGWDVTRFANITGGFTVDVCAWDGSNCSGGANQGIGEASSENFTIALTGTFVSPLYFDNFYARYQSIGVAGASGVISSTAVPEPMSLALLGSGLLGVGFLRRRKAA